MDEPLFLAGLYLGNKSISCDLSLKATLQPASNTVCSIGQTDRQTCYQVHIGCLTLGLDQWGQWKQRGSMPSRETERPPMALQRGRPLKERKRLDRWSEESLAGWRNSWKEQWKQWGNSAALEPCQGCAGDRAGPALSGSRSPAPN